MCAIMFTRVTTRVPGIGRAKSTHATLLALIFSREKAMLGGGDGVGERHFAAISKMK